MKNLKNKLLSAAKRGNFLKEVSQAYLDQKQKDDRNFVIEVIAELHNDNLIDLITEFSKLKSGSEFSTTRRIFEETLPKLSSPVLDVMQCVTHLVKEAGRNGAAPWVYSPFHKYCEVDVNRPNEAFQIILDASNTNKYIDCLTFTLWAGAKFDLKQYVSKTIELLEHDNIEIQKQAAYAIGNFNYQEDLKLIEDAFTSLEKLADNSKNEPTIINILQGSTSLFLLNKKLHKRLTTLYFNLLDRENEIIQYTASNLLFHNHKELPDKSLNLLLDSLKVISPDHKSTIDNIDYFLYDSLKCDKSNIATKYLESFLQENNDIPITTFDSFTAELYNKHHSTLNQLATRWFLSGNYQLMRAVKDILKQGHGNGIELFVDKNELSQNKFDGIYFFLTRKAIGWLYTEPVTAASFLISLLKIAQKVEAETITELLFHPLLISYPGNVKDYIEKILPESKKIEKYLKYTLDQLDRYHNGFPEFNDLAELRPSLTQKETYSRYFSRLMNDAFKEAQKHSITSQLFHTSVLLYGKESIWHTNTPDGETCRTQTPLHSIGASIEFPSLPFLDPIGIEHMLYVFKNERCKQ